MIDLVHDEDTSKANPVLVEQTTTTRKSLKRPRSSSDREETTRQKIPQQGDGIDSAEDYFDSEWNYDGDMAAAIQVTQGFQENCLFSNPFQTFYLLMP